MANILPLRLAVEAVVQRGSDILLVKRANTCKVAPGVWNVPAGKAEFTKAPFVELPNAAVKRECREETGMEVRVIKELAVRIFQMPVGYRVMHTFLVEPIDPNQEVKLNHEHSEFVWVSQKNGWKDPKYDSLSDALKEIFKAEWE